MFKQDLEKIINNQGKIVESQQLKVESPYADKIEIFRLKYLSDGLKIVGFILRPRNLVPGQKLPAILYNRPGIGDSHKINNETLGYLSLLPANGFLVGASQYRGNDGSEGSESYLDKDINDALNMLNLIRSLPEAATDNVGILGFSRGAAVTYQLLKEQVKIKAACVMGCATDFLDAYKQLPHYRPFLEAVFGGTPQETKAEYIKRSPQYWPEKINVPLLIIQGTDDHHVPIQEVKDFARKLEDLNKVHEMVIYPEGDHTLDKVRADKDKRILTWFTKFLK